MYMELNIVSDGLRVPKDYELNALLVEWLDGRTFVHP